MFNPTRLSLARKRRRLSKSGLAAKIGVSLRSITGFERGEFEPSDETLTRTASVLEFPIEWFSGPDLPCPSPDSASFRSQARMTASNRDAALALGSFAFLVSSWLESRFTLPPPDLPDLRDAEPEVAAVILRQHWGLGERPIKNLVHLMESKGVRVFSMAEDTAEVDAFSSWNTATPFVFLNTMKSADRSRFDAAHELGHLVLHRHPDRDIKQNESEANRFASAFLMPRGSVLGLIPIPPTLNALVQLKRHWIVSVSALVRRLKDLGVLTEWHYRSLCMEMGQKGYRTKEPEEATREMSLMLPKLFKALREDGVTKSELARELWISMEDLDALVFRLILTVLEGGTFHPKPCVGRRADLKLVM